MSISDHKSVQGHYVKNSVKETVLVSPSDKLKPVDFCEFIHLPYFDEAVDEFNFDDDDITALQMMIMADPKGSPVIPGTSGLRKLRFSPPGDNRGKSGAYRVCYLFLEEVSIIILILLYSKNELDNISKAAKQKPKKIVNEIKVEYSK